jgi:hypothetical protein
MWFGGRVGEIVATALELARVSAHLPGPEDALAQLQAHLTELLLRGEPFGVGLEVALQV